ncbi:MAG: xanthine phosphoribosyltransferase [Solobacterium sp.]|nr:xanthine phosphoribosyltransferase [Solobacterium sp.]
MKELEEKIRKEGKPLAGDVLNVTSFLNQQIDIAFLTRAANEFYRLFQKENVTKILTLEASGIPVATLTASVFGVPLVYVKKSRSSNLGTDVYTSRVRSYTQNRVFDITVGKDYLKDTDTVLIIDDFLANGAAAEGLADLIRQAGASLAGIGIVIEKGFQKGGDQLREKGIRVESLAIIEQISEDGIVFREEKS